MRRFNSTLCLVSILVAAFAIGCGDAADDAKSKAAAMGEKFGEMGEAAQESAAEAMDAAGEAAEEGAAAASDAAADAKDAAVDAADRGAAAVAAEAADAQAAAEGAAGELQANVNDAIETNKETYDEKRAEGEGVVDAAGDAYEAVLEKGDAKEQL